MAIFWESSCVIGAMIPAAKLNTPMAAQTLPISAEDRQTKK